MTRRLPPCRSPRFDGLVEELEPRILFSADLPAALLPMADPSQCSAAVCVQLASSSQTGDVSAAVTHNEVAFVDASVPDAQQLVNLLRQQTDPRKTLSIYWLDANKDGVQQITDTLSKLQGVDAVHILSHGSDGSLQLGNATLNSQTMGQYAAQLASWHQSLSKDADLMLYGCDVAQDTAGQHFVDDLHLLTGADVAASTDLTGSISLGGNWTLEYQDGKIQATTALSMASQLSWQGLLTTTTFQQGDANAYASTLDTYIQAGSPTSSAGGTATQIVGGKTTVNQQLFQFGNLFGSGANQIPLGSTITSATLTIDGYGTDPGENYELHKMLINWDESSTWNSLSSGVSTNNTDASSTVDATFTNTGGTNALTVTTDVQAWANGGSNYGWVIAGVGNNATNAGWYSSEYATVASRPKLSVTYTLNAPALDLDANNSSGATGVNFTQSWTEKGGAKVVADSDASLTDSGSANLTSLTATITNLKDGASESLAATTTGTSIVASYNSGTGVLTLSGTDTTAHYQQVLRTISYDNSSTNPNTTARSITFVANDGTGSGNSATATTTLSITAVNDAPTITSDGGGATASVNVKETLTAVTTVTATDPDSPTLTYSISGGADAAKFSINSTTGVLTFVSAPDYEAPTDVGANNVYDVTVQVSDGALTDTQAIAVTVTNVPSTLVVTTTADTNDSGLGSSFTAEQLNAVNGGADGKISLREALIAANGTAGTDTITFNIATGTAGTGSDTGAYVITATSALPTITGSVIIDASTQSGYVAGGLHTVVLDGNDAAAYGLDLNNASDGSTVRGLVIRNFTSYGIYVESGSDSQTIVGNYIGSFYADGSNAGTGLGNTTAGIYSAGANAVIGGTTAADRNVISGNSGGYNIYLATGADGTVIQGNYIGTNAAGTSVFSTTNPNYGIDVLAGSNITIGGTAAGAGNVISGHGLQGIYVPSAGTTTIQGNYIGTDYTGTVDLGNTQYGIYLAGGASTIGGTTAGAGNVISGNNSGGIYASNSSITLQGNTIGLNAAGTAALGNTGPGIYLNTSAVSTIGGNTAAARNIISGNSTYGINVLTTITGGHVIKGNYIGVGADGTTLLGNGSTGVYLQAGWVNVGGKAAGDGNIIAGNGGAGIGVVSAYFGDMFYRNSIYSNTGLGIDLGNDGVTVNDYNDADGGANYFSNYAVISSAVVNGTSTTITGSIDFYNHATADTIYIELFASPTLDPSGYGEGKTYLGAASVTTDATTGDATFSITVTGVSVGDYITAVANVETSYLGGSEFSPGLAATSIANAPKGKLIWTDAAQTDNWVSNWTGTGFTTPGMTGVNLGSTVTMMAVAEAPTRDEYVMIGSSDANGKIQALVWNGSSWSSPLGIPVATPSATAAQYDSFGVAYESQSGDALLVWDNGNTGTTGLSYAVWNGTSWSAINTITAPASGEPLQMKLATNPTADGMVLAVTTSTGNNYAVVWNGSSWGNSQTLGTNTNKQNFELNAAYESQTGHAMVVYDASASDSSSLQYRTWNGSSWSSEGTIAAPSGITAGSDVYCTAIASDATSNKIAVAVKDAANEVYVSIWSGSAWGNAKAMTTSGIDSPDHHATMAVAFESVSGDLLVAYGKAAGPNVYYQTFSAGAWSTEQTGPSMGATDITYSLKLYSDPYSNTIMMADQDGAYGLNMVAWDGSAWGTVTTVDANTVEYYRENYAFAWNIYTPPSVSNLANDTLAYTEKASATVIDQSTVATASDGDGVGWSGGNLTVSFTAGSTSVEDVLAVRNQGTGAGQIGVSGANITYAGATIGSYTGGSSGAALVITLNAVATNAAVGALVNNVTYVNANTTTPSTTSRTVRYVATNARGLASSNIDTTVTVTAVNDAPTLTATASNPGFTEAAGLGTQAAAVSVFSGAAISTIEPGQTISGLIFTVSGLVDGASEHVVVDGTTLSLGANSSSTTTTNGMSYSVTISSGTATIVLAKAAGISTANAQTLVNSISYQNVNTDNPTGGNRVFTLTQIQDNGGTSNGGVDTTTLSQASTVTVNAVNDAPTLSSTALNPTFTEGSGAGVQGAAVQVFSGTSVSAVESGQTISGLTFTVSGLHDGANESIVVDGSTITLGGNSASTTASNGMTYSVSIVSGTATVSLTKAAGISTGNAQTLVNGLTYQNTNADNPTTGNRVFTLTQIKDNGGTSNGGVDTTTLSTASTVAVTPLNDAPTLSATASNPGFTEAAGSGSQAAAVNVFSGTAISTVESGQTISGLTFTVSGLLDGSNEAIVVDGSTLTLGGASSGTTSTNGMSYSVAVSSGTATISLTKAAGISTANAQTLVNSLTYQNTNTDNPSSGTRVFTLTQIKDNGGTSNGGSDTSTLSVASTVTVNAVNDAPTLTATATSPTFTEAAGLGAQASSVQLFSGAAVSTVESGQLITSLSFTISGIVDGINEKITVDGTAITLNANSTPTTATNGMSCAVTVSGGNATVVLTKAGGITTAQAQTLVNTLSYQNTSTDDPTAGNRVFTLTQVKDNGGTANGGTDTSALSIASTVNVKSVNDAPSLTSTAANPTFTEAAGSATQAAPVNLYTGTAISTIESGQTIAGLTFTVSGLLDGANESIVVDGSTITLGANSSSTTATNGMSYSVTISSGTATVVLTNGAGISTAAAQTLVNGLTYQNTNTDNPTAGNRVFTLTQIKDNGGTANSGADTTALSIASTVTVRAVNDAPNLSATASNPTFTEPAGLGTQGAAVNVYTGTAISTIESGQTISGLTFTVSGLLDGANESLVVDGKTITLGANSAGTTTTNSLTYSVTVSSGTATISLTGTLTSANAQNLVNSLTYQNTNTDNPTSGNRVFTLTQIKDSGGTTNGGSDTSTLAIASTITVSPTNDAPVAHDDTASTAPSTAIDVNVKGNDTDADNTVNSLVVTIVSTSPGTTATVNPDGTIHFDPLATSGAQTVVYYVTDPGSLSSANATLTVNVIANTPPTSADVTRTTLEDTPYALQTGDFTFADADVGQTFGGILVTSLPTTGSLTLNGAGVSANDVITSSDIALGHLVFTPATNANGLANSSFSFKVQDNLGGTAVSANAFTFDVTPVDDAPTLITTALNPSFIEAPGLGTQAAAVNVFSGTSIDTIETGQTIKGLTFTVSGLADGNNEVVMLDGLSVGLGSNSSGTTTTNGMSYSVNISGATATVALTHATGITSAAAAALVDNISYQNTNTDTPTIGNRVFTLTQIQDSGSTANGGVTTTSLSSASTVGVQALNDAPTVTLTALNPTFTEANGQGTQAPAVSAFSGTSVNTIESAQSIINLSFTVSGLLDGANEVIQIDGTSIALGASSSGTSSGHALGYTVTVSGGSATISLVSATGISAANAQALINGITYQNTNLDTPTAGNRIITLTQIQDDGGIANGGTDTSAPNLASTVLVVPVNDTPTLSNNNGLTLNEGAMASIDNTMLAVSDVDNSPVELTYTVTASPAHGHIELTSNPGVAISSFTQADINNGLLRYQHDGSESSSDSMTFTVSDGAGGSIGSTAFSISVTPVNDAPTLTTTALDPSFTEAAGQGTQASGVTIFTGTTVDPVEVGQNITSLTFTVGGLLDGNNETISVDGTILTLGSTHAGTTSANSLNYSVSLVANTATVALTKGAGISAATAQSVIDGMSYQNTDTDNPTGGARVVTLTQIKDSGGTSNGGIDTSTLSWASTISVTPVNDAPTLSSTGLNPTFTEAAGLGTQSPAVLVFSGTSIGMVETGQAITDLSLTISGIHDGSSEVIVVDGSTLTLGANQSGTTSGSGLNYSVTISGTTATVALNSAAGMSATATQGLMDGITYQNTNTDDLTAGNRVFTLTTIQDNGGTLHGGANTSALSLASTVNVVTVNDAPSLSTSASNPTFTEAAGLGTQATAVTVFSGTAVSALETSQTIQSLSFTVSGIVDGASECIVVDGTTVTLGSSSSGTTTTNGMSYTSTLSGGTATVILSKVAGVSTANMQTLVDGIAYQNTSTDDPTSGNRVFTLTQIQDNGGTANGGVDTTLLSTASTVTVTPVNDAPTLTATAVGGTFTEGAGMSTGAAVSLFSGSAVSTIEAGQTITSLTFTVANVLDATEVINVDGSTLALSNAATGSTTTNGMTYNITVSSGTATVVLTKGAGISSTNIQTLVNGISYQNTSQDPTSGARTITLTQITDSGGTANSGADTTTLSMASTVAVTPLNDAPTLTATPLGGTFTEGAGVSTGTAVSLFNGSAISTIEAGQTITSLTFTVGNMLDASEVINVDGSTIALSNAATGTTTTNGMTYNVSVSSGTATVVLSKVAGVSSATIQTLVDGMSYQNTSQDPTTGTRTVTLTQLKDSGGTTNGGVDTTNLSIASTVAVTPVNDAPSLTATPINPTFTEAAGLATQAAPVTVFSGSAISVVEAGQTITDLTFTISGIVDGVAERIVVDGTSITLGSSSSGTTTTNAMSYTSTLASGTATVVLSKVAGVSTAAAQTLVNGITYQNTNTDDPTTGNRIFTVTQLVDSGGTANGGVNNSTPNPVSTVTVTARNDPPSLSATGLDPAFTEAVGASAQAAPVNVFNASTITTIEAGQSITSITLSIAGLLDGTHEVLSIDGSALDLSANNAGSTTTNGMSYTVSLAGSTATITLSHGAGISTAAAQNMINGITYQNTLVDTPSPGTRTVTLAQLQDNGGSVNGGADTTTLSIASHILVASTNDTPTGAATITGVPTQNQTLTASNTIADPDGMGTITYHWLRNGLDTSSTGNTYLLTQADVGTQITVNAVYVDGGGTTETVTSSATSAVVNVNDAPVMSVTTLTATAMPSVSWQASTLLAQAVDPDNDPLTVLVAQAPQHGTLSVLGNGEIQYTANTGYVGADAFTYRAFDGQASSASARQMSIQVSAMSINMAGPSTNTETPSTTPQPDPVPVENRQPDQVTTQATTKPKAPDTSIKQTTDSTPSSDTTSGELHQHIPASAWIRHGSNEQVGLLKQTLFNAGTSSYATTSAEKPSGTPSIMHLLELIQPNVDHIVGINLLTTPLSSIGHALPSRHDAAWMADSAGDEPTAIRITRAASYSTGLGLSIGTIWWTARVSGLVTSALISTPAWRALDPLPVLTSPTGDDDDNEHHMGDKEIDHLFDADRAIEQDLPIIQ